jgi:hypothetical protein
MTDIHNYYSNINNSNVNFNQKLQNSAYNAFLLAWEIKQNLWNGLQKEILHMHIHYVFCARKWFQILIVFSSHFSSSHLLIINQNVYAINW